MQPVNSLTALRFRPGHEVLDRLQLALDIGGARRRRRGHVHRGMTGAADRARAVCTGCKSATIRCAIAADRGDVVVIEPSRIAFALETASAYGLSGLSKTLAWISDDVEVAVAALLLGPREDTNRRMPADVVEIDGLLAPGCEPRHFTDVGSSSSRSSCGIVLDLDVVDADAGDSASRPSGAIGTSRTTR